MAIAVIIGAAIGSAIVYLEFFNDNENEQLNNIRQYNEGDQIKSTVKWKDDSGAWHTGKYVFTVVDREKNRLMANVVYSEGSIHLSQSINVTKSSDKYTISFEKFNEKTIEYEQKGEKVVIATYECSDDDLLSRLFEMACNTFTSCGMSNTNIDPKGLFDDTNKTHQFIMATLYPSNGIFHLNQALYKDGTLHRSTIIAGSNLICSDDPDLVKNHIGDGIGIEHVDLKIAGTTWDCLKITLSYGEDVKRVDYYTVDGFLLLKSQIGYTTVQYLDSFSNNYRKRIK